MQQTGHTSGQQENAVHTLVRRLDAVHNDLGVVFVADVERIHVVQRVDPVAHFRMVPHHADSGQWQ